MNTQGRLAGIIPILVSQTKARRNGKIDLIRREGKLFSNDIPNLDVDLRPVKRPLVWYFHKRRPRSHENITHHFFRLNPKRRLIHKFLPQFLGIMSAKTKLVAINPKDGEVLQIHRIHGLKLRRKLLLGTINMGVIHLHRPDAHQAK